VLLPSKTAALGQPGSASSWLAEDCGTSSTHDDCLGVAEDSGNPIAARTLDVHKVAVWMLDKPLELVLPLFFCWERMQQIFSQRHFVFSLVEVNQANIA